MFLLRCFHFLLSGPSLSSHLDLGRASRLVLFSTSHAHAAKVPQRLPAESWIVLPHSRRAQVQPFTTHAKSYWKCRRARHKRPPTKIPEMSVTLVHSHFSNNNNTDCFVGARAYVCAFDSSKVSVCARVFLCVFMARRLTLVCARMCSEGTDCDCSLWVLAFGAGSARSGQGGGKSRHAQSAHICSNTRDPQSHTGNMCEYLRVCVCVRARARATEAALCERNL